MKLYHVDLEVREQGAIGIFLWKQFPAYASKAYLAARRGFKQANDRGYETRNGPIVYRDGIVVYPDWLVDKKTKTRKSFEIRKLYEAKKVEFAEDRI